MSDDAPLTSINNKNVDDDASELSVESLEHQELSPHHSDQQPQNDDDDEEEERRQSYLPQQLIQQSKQVSILGSPKLSDLPEKWNQSFGSSVGSVHSTDSPVVYATINLPSVRSSMATAKINNTTSASRSRSRSPVKIDVTTTATGRALSPPPPEPTRSTTTSNSRSPPPPRASTINRTPASRASTRKSKLITPRKSRMNKSPKRSPTRKNHQSNITPPPPDMNAGLYYFAQMGPEQQSEPPPPVIIETYQGSCQCGEIQLQVRLPRDDGNKLEVETTEESTAVEEKIYYRYIRVKQTDFDITKGQARMSTYFVTMSAPPILSTASSSVSSEQQQQPTTRKSKFFIRPNSDNTSPRSQSKAARVFCPQCGVNILYIPGKNAPKVHLNINCFLALAKNYPPPPPPPLESQSLQQEAWFWDYSSYSQYLMASRSSTATTGVAIFLDWCWQWIHDTLDVDYYLPLIQDYLREYLFLSIMDDHSHSLPPDTPHSVGESVKSVERAFQGTLTPSGSFLDSDEEDEDIILDDKPVLREDGSFKEELLIE